MNDRARDSRRAERLVALGGRFGLGLSLALAAGAIALVSGWIDSAPQAAAMVFVALVLGLFAASVLLHVGLLAGAMIVGRRRGLGSVRGALVSLLVAVAVYAGLAALVLWG